MACRDVWNTWPSGLRSPQNPPASPSGFVVTGGPRAMYFTHHGKPWLKPITTPFIHNKTNLRDLIAATCLVILLKLDSNHELISPCDLKIWWMTSKNNKAPLLYYIKLCAPFQIHCWIQTGVTVRKRSFQVKIGDFLSHVTLKFYGWPWKTIGHLFYTTSSFVHHFKSISEVKLELQSRNAQFGSKLVIFMVTAVTLKFYGWLWKTIGHLLYTTLSFVQHLKAIGIFKLELQSGNAQFRSKSAIFCPRWPWKLTDDLVKQQGTFSMLLQALCIIS